MIPKHQNWFKNDKLGLKFCRRLNQNTKRRRQSLLKYKITTHLAERTARLMEAWWQREIMGADD